MNSSFPSRRRLPRSLGVVVVAAVAVATAGAAPPARADDGCGDLLIVLDRSGSMSNCTLAGKTKEAIAKTALRALTSTYATTPMGLAVFPDTLDMCPTTEAHETSCARGVVVRDVAADGAPKVADWLAKMPTSCGGTPTGSTLEVVRDYTGWSHAKKHYVLLLTDGQPTCDDGDDGGTWDAKAADMCVPGGPGIPCNGQGRCECKNPTRAFDAIKAMQDSGTDTFVVGFAGEGTGAGCSLSGLPFNPDTLDKMAVLGGQPQEAPAATRYYSATDAASLDAALHTILGKIAGGTVGGCVPGSAGGAGGSMAPDAGGGAGAGGGGAGGSDGDNGAAPGPEDGSPRGTTGCGCESVGRGDAPYFGALALLVLFVAALGSGRKPRELRGGARDA